MTTPVQTPPVPVVPEPVVAPVPTPPVVTAPETPLHDDPVIAKALEGLTPEQRETLLTTGGKNALAARAQEVKDAKAAVKTAADTAKAELAQSIGKALGLVQDETVDPVKLTEQLTSVGAENRQVKTELAVFHAASAVGADAAALLDSRGFMAKLADVDPTDAAAIATVIAEAVTANPALVKAAPSRIPAPNPALGSSANGAPDLEAQIAQATKAGDVKLAIHLQNQKLLAQQ